MVIWAMKNTKWREMIDLLYIIKLLDFVDILILVCLREPFYLIHLLLSISVTLD